MSKTVLIIDDELVNREILRNILQEDYNVLTAESGLEALAIMQDKHSLISAVLLDLRMPDMDGFEVLEALYGDQRFRPIPVIVVTAMTDTESEEKAVSLGAYSFVSKPYKSVLIKHHINNAISLRETAALQNKIRRDDLTGILNMTGFAEQAWAMVQSEPAWHYILSCFDVDSFKVVNDQYGTEKGDCVLRHIAETVNDCMAKVGGICCRISSDDFAVLYPASYAGSDIITECIAKASAPECISRDITIRIGRYHIGDRSVPVIAMYDRAILAKETIRGRYDVHEATYDAALREKLLREQQIVSDMGSALENRQFEVWYQPQYNHSSGALIGAEALVRWRHPENGLVAPNDFIPIFERNGFIYSLDKYVWEQVCSDLRRWIDLGKTPLPASVNISRQDICNGDVVEVLTKMLDKYSLPASMLRLEITETAFSVFPKRVSDVVIRLIDKGFTVEIDDFGSGYSSLNTLKDIPAQIIKLDMRFLERSADSRRSGNIVESIVRMAKWLGMSVIAEGVETRKQADYLCSIGCNYVQGYLYSKPIPAAEYEAICGGSIKEEHLLTLETVENLDNNSFWDPESLDTLIFNSYIGGACIYEYHDGGIELIRATKKYIQVINSDKLDVEAALKLDWMKYFDEESAQRLIKDIEESARTKKEVTGEYILVGLPGCSYETYLKSSLSVIASAGNRYLVYCTNENITAQRISEKNEELAITSLRGMMNDMPGGFIRASIDESGNIKPVYVNNGFLHLIGMTREETSALYSHDFLAGVHHDDLANVKQTLTSMINTDEAQSCRYRLLRKDGSYIWIAVFGRLTKDSLGNRFLNIYFTDASKQVLQEEYQKALLDNLPVGAGVYEFADGQMRLIYQNNSYWELVGLHHADFPDPTPMSAIHPDDVPIVMNSLLSAIANNHDVDCDIRLRHLTRGWQPVRLMGRILNNKNEGFLIFATFAPHSLPSNAENKASPTETEACIC